MYKYEHVAWCLSCDSFCCRLILLNITQMAQNTNKNTFPILKGQKAYSLNDTISTKGISPWKSGKQWAEGCSD